MTKTLEDVFRDLSYGPLSNLSIGMEGAGTIKLDKQDRLVSLVNQGLTRIYSRVMVAQKELKLRTLVGRALYTLRKEHAESDDTLADKFIRDSVDDPFTGDLIRILAVFDCEGEEVPLNDSGAEGSVFTPKPDQLQLPHARGGETYYVLYQAAHPVLETGDPSQEIDLVEPLFEALEAFVAGKVLRSMNGAEHHAKGSELIGQFDTIIAEADSLDITKQSLATTTTKLEDRGFV